MISAPVTLGLGVPIFSAICFAAGCVVGLVGSLGVTLYRHFSSCPQVVEPQPAEERRERASSTNVIQLGLRQNPPITPPVSAAPLEEKVIPDFLSLLKEIEMEDPVNSVKRTPSPGRLG